MSTWQELLEVRWPQNACDRSGECCRGAAQAQPWTRLLPAASAGDLTARAFLNQFMPYPSLDAAQQHAPHAFAASMALARERGDADQDIVFYHCRFLAGQSDCQIYEDRPALCRDFPESPFGAIPSCCGYYTVTLECREKAETLRRQLADLKWRQAMQQSGNDSI